MKKHQRLLALIMSLMMVFQMMPTSALAAGRRQVPAVSNAVTMPSNTYQIDNNDVIIPIRDIATLKILGYGTYHIPENHNDESGMWNNHGGYMVGSPVWFKDVNNNSYGNTYTYSPYSGTGNVDGNHRPGTEWDQMVVYTTTGWLNMSIYLINGQKWVSGGKDQWYSWDNSAQQNDALFDSLLNSMYFPAYETTGDLDLTKRYEDTYIYNNNTSATKNIWHNANETFTLDYPGWEGHQFDGWFDSATQKVYTGGSEYRQVTSSTTFTGLWHADGSVLIYPEGGQFQDGTTQSVTLGVDAAKNLMNNGQVTKNGTSLVGWQRRVISNSKVSWEDVDPNNINGGDVVRSVWGSAIVKFNLNGGTGTAPTSISTSYGASITIPAKNDNVTNYDLIFVGWSVSPYASHALLNASDVLAAIYTEGDKYTVKDAETTLYAIWSKKTTEAKIVQFAVRADRNVIPYEPQAQVSKNYHRYSAINDSEHNNDPTKYFKSFSTIYNDDAAIRANFTSEAPTDAQIIAELWTDNDFAWMKENGHSQNDYEIQWYVMKYQMVVDGNGNPVDFWGVGNLYGWYVDGIVKLKDDVVLKYDPNCPTDEITGLVPSSQTTSKNSTLSVYAYGSSVENGGNNANDKLSRPGYTFLGWAKDNPSATTPDYPVNGDNRNIGNITMDANHTLYGVWQKNTITVIVNKEWKNSDGTIVNRDVSAKFTLTSTQGCCKVTSDCTAILMSEH